MMIAFYHQAKTPIGFWCRRDLYWVNKKHRDFRGRKKERALYSCILFLLLRHYIVVSNYQCIIVVVLIPYFSEPHLIN